MPNPKYLLYFDGATSGGNPGNGGCGAYWYKNPYSSGGLLSNNPDQTPTKHEVSRTLGHVTSNAAEYNGLILGLRDILKEYPITTFDLMIFGDSELVIRQLSGEYEVNSPMLKIYFQIVQGLFKRIKGKIEMIHVPRDQNEDADRLAKKAAKRTNLDVDEWILFYPNLMNLYDATCEGSVNRQQLLVGSDMGTAGDSQEFIFDATTILKLFGKNALQNLRDPGKTTILSGKVKMTIVGILDCPIKCVINYQPDGAQLQVTLRDVVVVDSLPYDAQISFKHPMIMKEMKNHQGDGGFSFVYGTIPDFGHPFQSTSVATRFQSHHYWKDDSPFIVVRNR